MNQEKSLEDDVMICDVALMYRDNLKPLLSVKVHKLFTISFHEKYMRIKTSTESKDENYIVRRRQ